MIALGINAPVGLRNFFPLDGGSGCIHVGRTRLLPVGDGMRYSSWTPLSWGFQDAKHLGGMAFQAQDDHEP